MSVPSSDTWASVAGPTPTAETVMWVAQRVVTMHTEQPSDTRASGSCAVCLPGGGCEMLRWALDMIAQARARGWTAAT